MILFFAFIIFNFMKINPSESVSYGVLIALLSTTHTHTVELLKSKFSHSQVIPCDLTYICFVAQALLLPSILLAFNSFIAVSFYNVRENKRRMEKRIEKKVIVNFYFIYISHFLCVCIILCTILLLGMKLILCSVFDLLHYIKFRL